MAIFDDTAWLLSHIQNSYATSDDSGLSEIILQGDWPIEKLTDYPTLYSDSVLINQKNEDEEFQPHSLDVHSEQAYISHRFRSDTEHRLQKLKKEKTLQSKIQRITWTTNEAPLSESEAEELFGQKPVKPPQAHQQSLLSRLLEEGDKLAQNPYSEYAKWDASTDVNLATKRLSIYVYSSREGPTPEFPVPVVVSTAARVIDVIGLTCYLYTRDNLSPPLQLPVNAYSLRIADEDGSVDWEFMPLVHSHTIDKFGFKVLAVAQEVQLLQELQDWPVTVTVHISGGVFSLIECESKNITLREVLQRTIAKRREMAKVIEAGVQYHMEKDSDAPGKALDLEKTIAEVDSLNFHAVRDNSHRDPRTGAEQPEEDVERTKCFSFPVTWVKKWAKFEANVDVSSGGVFVSVSGGSSGALLRSPHPVSYSSNKIVCCNIKPSSGGGASRKASFATAGKDRSGDATRKKVPCEVLLTCQGEQRFKDYLFECSGAVAVELVEAVKKIKTGDSSHKKKKDEEKPRRRYSIAGLKKINRSSFNQKHN